MDKNSCLHGTYILVVPEILPNSDQTLPGGSNARADFWRQRRIRRQGRDKDGWCGDVGEGGGQK